MKVQATSNSAVAQARLRALHAERMQDKEKSGPGAAPGTTGEPEGDSVEISVEASAMRAVLAPDADAARADRIAQLRKAVADGNYEVRPDELAARLLGS